MGDPAWYCTRLLGRGAAMTRGHTHTCCNFTPSPGNVP